MNLKVAEEEIHSLYLIKTAITLSRKKARFLLLLIFLITSFFAFQFKNLKFDYNFDMFFPKGDADFAYYEDFTKKFGTDNDYFFVAFKSEDILSSVFLQDLNDLTESLSNWDEIEDVQSLTNQYRYQITPLGVNKIRLVNPSGQSEASLFENEDLMGQFIANDKKSLAMTIKHRPFTSTKSGELFYERLEKALNDQFSEVIISGKIEAQYHFVKKLEQELFLLLALSIGLVCVALYLIFKTIRGVLLPLVVLAICCIWSIGFISTVGQPLDVMMVMVPPILLVVAMSDVIHFCSKYNELIHGGYESGEAITITLKSVGLATLLTSISTAIGFATLIMSPIAPIRNFGVFTAIGVLFAYIITFSLLPSILIYSSRALNKNLSTEVKWSGLMHRLFSFVLTRRRKVLAASLTCIFLISSGVFFLRQNTFLIVGLKKSDPLMEKILFFDEQYNGSNTIEFIFNSDANTMFDLAALKDLEKITNFLTGQFGLAQPISPLSVIKDINQALNGGSPSFHILPENPSQIRKVKRIFDSRAFKEVRSQLQTDDQQQFRLSARQRDIGSFIAKQKYAELDVFFKDEIKSDLKNYRLTGTSFLINKTDTYVAQGLLKGLGLGLAIISIMLAILFKSPILALMSLIPNLIPLLCLFGLLGFLQVDLNISTTLIFGIAFGIAVDDSIHFLSRYQLEKKSGKPPLYALKRTFISTGKSIVLTTIVLCAGFILFAFSSFSASFYTGVFMSAALIIALLADLLLLPILLLGRKSTKAHQDLPQH